MARRSISGLAFAAPLAIVCGEFAGKSRTVPVRLVLLSCAAALILAGCGVKGPLEKPKGAAADAPTLQGNQTPMTNAEAARQAGDQAWGGNPVAAGGINPPDMPGNQVSRPAPAQTGPKKSFFLDFLL